MQGGSFDCCTLLYRLGIFKDLPFKVSEDNLFSIMEEDIVGIDRHLAATSRRINDELGNGVACRVAPESIDDFDPLTNRSSQMRRSLNQVALI